MYDCIETVKMEQELFCVSFYFEVCIAILHSNPKIQFGNPSQYYVEPIKSVEALSSAVAI